jgi:hypothetical protein
MTTRQKATFLLLLVALSENACTAAQLQPMPELFTGNSLGCGQWLADRHANRGYNLTVWLLGYLSAASYFMQTPLIQPWENARAVANTIDVYVDKYCRANPHEDITDAALAYLRGDK